MRFVSFHTHTTFSYADGYGTVEQHVSRVADLGMGALGVSEHGNVNSHPALERYCHQASIKPIFGIEAYLGPTGEKGSKHQRTQAKTHLGLYAMNQEGYHNLNKLVTQSYIDSHYFPTIDPKYLRKYNAGLVCLSGCSDSLISCTLLGGKFLGPRREPEVDGTYDIPASNRSAANRRISWFLDVFGPDRFFLEVQRFPNLDRTCAINAALAKLSKECGIPLIATADVHYPYPADNEIQAILHASRWKNQPDLAQEASWELTARLTYPESDDEIIQDLMQTGLKLNEAQNAVSQTSELAQRCNVELPKAKPLRFPGVNANQAILCGARKGKFPTHNDKEQVAKFAATLTLTEKIKSGWRERLRQRPDLASRKKEYSQRISQELKVIADKDFADYFLATADLVQWAKEPAQDITVGPGRGSAAGSLVCYVLGITEIDPLHPVFSRMIFERFIDPNRADMPDIDLDFDDELRHKIPARAREIYGTENVCNVANHNKYRGKGALAGVASAYGLPRSFFNEIGKRITDRVETDDRVSDSILDVVENYRTNPKISELLDLHGDKIQKAMRLEGSEHSMGIHAGGFVIASEPIPSVCAIYNKTKGQGRHREVAQVIPYEKRDAEYLNLLKMDFLGLTTMGQVGLCRKWTGMKLDELYRLFYASYENPQYNENDAILKLFCDDDITGIFQYEGGTTRQVVRDVRPSNFDELAACNALSRPGPLYGGQTSEYVKVKNGEKDWERIHPTGFDCHVEWTYGQIVYQEQIMWILRDLANFSTERVLKVRKIIGKKLGEFQFAELWEEFKTGCQSNGVSEENAGRVWSAITTAAGYAFNTSHAYSYALVAWWQAWFKIHHPLEFFAASLAKNGDGKDDLHRRTALCKDVAAHDFWIGDFDLNKMDHNWTVATTSDIDDFYDIAWVQPGYAQIPGIGVDTAKDIMAHLRSLDHPIKNDAQGWLELTNVKGVGVGTVEKMIVYCLRDDPLEINRVSEELSTFRKQLENGEFDELGLPWPAQFVGSGTSEFTGGETSSGDFESTGESIPDEDNWVAWVGFVSNIHEKDEIETQRQRTGKSVEEIRASMDDPEKSKKATLFGYDETNEVSIRVSRWVFDSLSAVIGGIEENASIVVVWGRTFAGRSNSIQARNIWVFDPD